MNINLFKLLDLIHYVKIKLGFHTPRSPYYLFKIKNFEQWDLDDLYLTLINLGYQYNYMSYQEPQQVFNVRKLYKNRQIHVRIYKDGTVHGHDEYNYEFKPFRHLRASTLTFISEHEREALKKWLGAEK